jgi:hypothetical protein
MKNNKQTNFPKKFYFTILKFLKNLEILNCNRPVFNKPEKPVWFS